MTVYPGPQLNQLQHSAATQAESVSGDPVAEDVDGELHAPDGELCVLCDGRLLSRQNVRRGPAGLRHETCPET